MSVDRDELRRLMESIIGNADVAITLANDPKMTDRGLEIETAGRCKYIATRLAEVEALLLRGEPHGKAGLHLLGDRPNGDAA